VVLLLASAAVKTALIQEFSRVAQDAHEDLIVASGNCSAYTGIGDPVPAFSRGIGNVGR
jgi:hypothetical protein